MTTVAHPLKGVFDMASATWTVIRNGDGTPGLEIGFADNGLVALCTPGTDGVNVLIYTPAEWEAFVAGVKDDEFDLDTF